MTRSERAAELRDRADWLTNDVAPNEDDEIEFYAVLSEAARLRKRADELEAA